MEVSRSIFILIVCCSLVTLLPRVLPLMVLSRFSLPDWALRWLSHIPIAVMAALVGQELLQVKDSYRLADHMDLLAGILTFFVAAKTKSLLWTVIFGVMCTLVLRWMAA
ncbi:AzlD domain-containing protein [Cohnella pontilimi]|uniref:AzlD domain-containing protein n=1 Tax=Cohnella pontilimi TaxID=2564100 RepID=A0A4V5LRZ5_9BACL|nr:AzlD domain-containing protein [Cohnella pontilimi]TJY41119.1 AzlD domain-containing protein [Cohnella pontilimi]